MYRLKIHELKEFRKRYASIRKMAQLTDYSPTTIQSIEKGVSIDYRRYLKYADVLSKLSKRDIDIDFRD